jgi:thymidylate kinase
LIKLYDSVDDERQIIVGMAHGDFTPWNTFVNNEKIAIIDWEFAKIDMPLGFDFFHFHMQSGIMLHRKNWQQIRVDINAALTPEMRTLLFKNENADIDLYLKLYLLYHIKYHIDLYGVQQKWHDQVYWQIDTWSEALLSMLDEEDVRKDFIHSVFSDLHYKDYAVLKAGDIHPADIKEGGDIDIVMRKQDCEKLYNRLSNNVLVKGISLQKKSFMYALRIKLVNDEWVFMDLIWQIKHKATVFMNVDKVLKSAFVNNFGIKVVSESDTACFIKHFYLLNNAPIPDKYANDRAMQAHFAKHSLVENFNDRPENKGWSKIMNIWSYCMDTVKMLFVSKGYIITFSGVDGAGKSTIIDEVKDHVDKVWRKPVVVLRHRPSVLPILSAYVHGKEKAEALTVSKLPRTGGNTNLFSSIARWIYYLIDYVFGQIYLKWKYLSRGYVIIYDRYYYDFICDAKRSNIELPKRLLSWGINIVAKPDFNFFLYASPEIILARKQELDGNVIKQLTDEYLKSFSVCKNRFSNKVFLPIENIDKVQTMHIIKSTINKII